MANKLIIPGRLDGLNEVIEANRTNKYAGNLIKKQNERIVRVYARQQKLKPIDKYPLKVVIDWYEKDRRRDWDNVMSAKKFIFDGLQKAKVLKGDGQKYICQIEEHQHIDKVNPRIEIEFIYKENAK